MTATKTLPNTRPAHVPPELVRDFDMYALPSGSRDAQAAYHAIQNSHPDVFWTPRNGGHWVATRGEDIEAILRDTDLFSSKRILIPRDDAAAPLIPIEIDAPRHTQLRKPLTAGLLPKVVDAMEDGIRELTVSLIEDLRPKGGCEFVGEFAQVLPLCIFLDLVELPRAERLRLHPLVERFVKGGSPEIRAAAHAEVFGYIQNTVRARRARPGLDLASRIVNCEVDGALIGEEDATGYLTMVLFAGLDTVASMLSYIMLFLATHRVERQQLIAGLDDEPFLRRATEELFRRHGIIVTGRTLTRDTMFGDVSMLANDAILPVNMLYGLDQRLIERPLEIDFDRPSPARHLTFGAGPHMCPGAILARREVKIFLQEWLTRIAVFELQAGHVPDNVTGLTCGLKTLHLCW